MFRPIRSGKQPSETPKMHSEGRRVLNGPTLIQQGQTLLRWQGGGMGRFQNVMPERYRPLMGVAGHETWRTGADPIERGAESKTPGA